MITSTRGQGSLFDSGDEPAAVDRPAARREATKDVEAGPLGMLPAAARLVVTNSPDRHDRQQRLLVLLVVERCPFCEARHIHPAGHPDAPRVCPRRARCIGRPAGAYYFPGVLR